MKLIYIIIIFWLYGCIEGVKQQEEIISASIPIGAIPIEWNGDAITHEMCFSDSVKVTMIVDSGIGGFLFDSTFLVNNSISIIHDPLIHMYVTTPFNQKVEVYETSVDRNMSHLYANKEINIWAVNFSKNFSDIDKYNAKGLIPLRAFSNNIIQIDLAREYLMPLDSIRECGYTKYPVILDRGVPFISLPVTIEKDNIVYDQNGIFMVDHGYIGSIGLNSKILDRKVFKDRRDTLGIKFDNIKMQNIPICQEPLSENLMGILGVKFLARFNVIIDYKGKYLYLKPNDEL